MGICRVVRKTRTVEIYAGAFMRKPKQPISTKGVDVFTSLEAIVDYLGDDSSASEAWEVVRLLEYYDLVLLAC